MRAVVLAVVVVVVPGCRQLFGIDDTDVAGDASRASDGGNPGPDAPFGTPDASPDARRSDAAPVICPVGYTTIVGATSKYHFNGANRPWATAVSECAADDPDGHTHLVVIEDAFEASALGNQFPNDYWVGYTDAATEGTWLTVFGTPATYLPWAPGEPNGGTVENCLKIGNGSQWADADCPNANNYVCECE